MAYASQAGRARTNPKSPQAHAICDRCGFRYNHVNLKWQYDWRGTSLQNIRFLVCDTCYDVPQEQLRAIVIPADPTPIMNPRVEDFVTASTSARVISGRIRSIAGLTSNGSTVTILFSSTTPPSVGSVVYVYGVNPSGYNGTVTVVASSRTSLTYANTTTSPYVSGGSVSIGGVAIDPVVGIPVYETNTRITQNGDTRVTQQTGEAPFGKNQLAGTDPNAIAYRIVANANNNGSGLIRLTLNTTNGMITNQHVVIQEVGGVPANGNWAITVIDASNIDLQSSTFSGTYTSGGYVINNPSLPYGFAQVPRTGSL